MRSTHGGSLSLIVAVLAGSVFHSGGVRLRAAEAVPAKPGLADIRALAEEGFIYGLPIVMNYAVMYEYCVDKGSGQYKGPFNTIVNEARVFTYKDTSVISGDWKAEDVTTLHRSERVGDNPVCLDLLNQPHLQKGPKQWQPSPC